MLIKTVKAAKSLLIILLLVSVFQVEAVETLPPPAEGEAHEQYEANEITMKKLLDSYKWEFLKWRGKYLAIELPRIFYNQHDNKPEFFLTTKRAIQAGYVDVHSDHFLNLREFTTYVKHGKLLVPEAAPELERIETQMAAAEGDEQQMSALTSELNDLIAEYKPWDFSITKNVLYMFFAAILMLLVFIPIANRYKKNPSLAPKGAQSFFEPIVVFIRDDVAKTNIPHQYEKFLPLLCTMFFFILFLNILGLTPFGANVTGNISVTLALSLVTLFFTNVYGSRHYWGHIFWFPGVPIALKPLMFIVEFIGVFTKPFALMIRLFANMTAGHVIVVSLIGLIFILGKMGANPYAGWGASIISVAFGVFIGILKVFVAFLQAFVFTLLSSVFIGMAVEDHHEEPENLHVE